MSITLEVKAIDADDLVLVVYNENDNEVLVNLGDLSEIDLSMQNTTLSPPGTVVLSQFSTVSEWSELDSAYFCMDFTNYGFMISTTKDTLSSLNLPGAFPNFRSSASAIYINAGDGGIYVGSSSHESSFNNRLNSNGNSKGFYGGVNINDAQFGEVNLAPLDAEGGYVDMYLYHLQVNLQTAQFELEKGVNINTEYTAVLRFKSDGSVVLNPPAPLNDPPTISGDPETSVDEDHSYYFMPTASDPENDELTFSINKTISWADFDTDTGELSGTPTNDDVGTTSNIIISVSDGNNDDVSLPAFNIEVVAVNDPPQISGNPATSVAEDNEFNFTPTAFDEENADLTFSINKTPSWASFDTESGKLSGTPTNIDGGTSITGIIISVSDGNSSDSLPAFNIEVVAVNDPPVIEGNPATTVNEDVEYSFTPTASDEEGAVLTFSINKTPSWASFSTSSGKLSGTPVNSHGGTVVTGIIISVSDGNSSDSLPAFDIAVSAVNDPPIISGNPATSVNETADTVLLQLQVMKKALTWSFQLTPSRPGLHLIYLQVNSQVRPKMMMSVKHLV